MTKTLPLTRPQPATADADALAFALAHHRWLTLGEEPQSWTEPDRRRALAAAFLRFHAAKLALTDAKGVYRPADVS